MQPAAPRDVSVVFCMINDTCTISSAGACTYAGYGLNHKTLEYLPQTGITFAHSSTHTHTLPHTHPLPRTHTQTHPLSLIHTRTHTHTLSRPLSLTRTGTHYSSVCLSLSPPRAHTHTHTMSVHCPVIHYLCIFGRFVSRLEVEVYSRGQTCWATEVCRYSQYRP